MKKLYIVEREEGGINAYECETRNDAIKQAIEGKFCTRSDIKSVRVSEAYKAYLVYFKALSESETTAEAAAEADKKGYNWTCDFQEKWHEALEEIAIKKGN